MSSSIIRLRASYTRDQVLEGPRDKTAAGIRFRQEFDSLDELLKSISRKKAEKKKSKTELEN
jgi:hypothetical protein